MTKDTGGTLIDIDLQKALLRDQMFRLMVPSDRS